MAEDLPAWRYLVSLALCAVAVLTVVTGVQEWQERQAPGVYTLRDMARQRIEHYAPRLDDTSMRYAVNIVTDWCGNGGDPLWDLMLAGQKGRDAAVKVVHDMGCDK